jgi:hypothetical protein
VWVRGVPVSAPMAKVAVLYERVVYVVTGSGIGLYGALVDEVQAAQPDAVIWDTTERGKPDLVACSS